MPHPLTPPRIYITSVEEGTVEDSNAPPKDGGPSLVGARTNESGPSSVAIPSIDLAMALSKQQLIMHPTNNDGALPLTSVGDSEWHCPVRAAVGDGGGENGAPQQYRRPASPADRSAATTMAMIARKCPSLERNWPVTSQPLALLIVFAFLWAVAYAILPPELSHPAGGLMRLVFLFVGAQACGILVSLTGLPDMLGMLFWGVLYANVGWADFAGYERVEVFLREMALVNIMLLAGLGLDYAALRSLFRFIMQLTLVPTVAEVAAVAVLSHYLLALPWLWGVLLGLVETAISPNVVVTVLLRLKEERLGLNKGIHTLIIAMTSCNDVLAIFLFGVILGVIFSTGDLTSQILQGPIGIVIGLVYGGLCGVALLYVPSYHAKYTNGLRFSMAALAGTLSVVGSKKVGYPSAGALGCIVTAFVAGTGWRKRPPTERNEVSMYLDLLWKFLKPVSFSLIGKEVNFSVLAGETVLYGAVTLLVAVLLRLIFSYLSTMGSELNWKEKAYVTLSGFPKATVQAALGPAALDLARSLNATEEYARAQTVLIVTVLAIIFTAPLGALLMIKLAPRWLKRSTDERTDQYS
ncbi:sodium/hydrogen exchanger 9B2 isoform X1 [Anopheles stephensi]|uniref:sodium/hydrogen exchanger 9B2 isoform X1 n=2 Tax=Anopheles stephensi TaxID=30069 RepID=UPI0016589BAD|nr:sodium/hydrogen exchanger 9B2 isoform X1 [Anopheles stephensi]